MLLRQLNDARALRVPGAAYSNHTLDELRIFETARSGRERFGAQAIRHAIISHTETVSDLLEVMLLQKEAGLMHGLLQDTEAPTLDATASSLPPKGELPALGRPGGRQASASRA